MKCLWVYNTGNPMAVRLAQKLAAKASPGAIIPLSEEEMEVLRREEDFFALELSDMVDYHK